MKRRQFLQAASISAAALGLGAFGSSPVWSAEPKRKLKKALKFDMIDVPGTIEERLNLAKELGFQGVEMNSPVGAFYADAVKDLVLDPGAKMPEGIDYQEAAEASKRTGVAIHGIIDNTHWKVRHSDPNPAVREKAFKILIQALHDAKTVGASTVLLVPGKVTDKDNENWQQCWDRSTESVTKAIPIAKELGVKIAIEVVWNDFLTTPEQLIKYVDQFNDPTVGAYFDCSNMIKYGVPSGDWIRQLGKRMLKFDFKGYKHGSKTKWVAIGEGDEDWPDILKALDEVGYEGFATSEVKGGGKDYLAEVSKQMDRVLQLGPGA